MAKFSFLLSLTHDAVNTFLTILTAVAEQIWSLVRVVNNQALGGIASELTNKNRVFEVNDKKLQSFLFRVYSWTRAHWKWSSLCEMPPHESRLIMLFILIFSF